MNTSLLQSVLTVLNANSWVTKECWDCLRSITAQYFDSDILILSEFSYLEPLTTKQTVYTGNKNSNIATPANSNILIMRDLTAWNDVYIQGKVILLTINLNSVGILWERLKIIDLVVINQLSGAKCDLYSWFPYDKNKCKKGIVLEKIDSWEYGRNNNTRISLFPNKIPDNFKNCPLRYGTSFCAPFITYDNNILSGPEYLLMQDIFKSYNVDVHLHFYTDQAWYYSLKLADGSISGIYKLLQNNTFEIGGGCMSYINDRITMFDILPSHLADYLVWLLPPPQPVSKKDGLYIGFKLGAWLGTIITVLSTFILCCIAAPSERISSSVLWTISRLLSVPCNCLRTGTVISIFGIFFEMCILAITSLYRSTLLLNLTFERMEGYKVPQEALKDGLKFFYYFNFKHLQNQSHHEFWNIAMAPERSSDDLFYSFEDIRDRKAFALGLKYLDASRLSKEFYKQPFNSLVYEASEKFQKMGHIMLLQKNHPLLKKFTEYMHRCIESGLPSFYLKQQFYKSYTVVERDNDDDDALELSELLAAFYLLCILLTGCLLTFFIEIFSEQILKKLKGLKRSSRRSLRISIGYITKKSVLFKTNT